MSKVTKRSEHGLLLREAEKDFANIKNKLINLELADLDIGIHGLLSTVSVKYIQVIHAILSIYYHQKLH